MIPGTFALTFLGAGCMITGIMAGEFLDHLVHGRFFVFVRQHPLQFSLTLVFNAALYFLVRAQLRRVRADRSRPKADRDRPRVGGFLQGFKVTTTPFVHAGVSLGAYVFGVVMFFVVLR